MIDFTHMVKFQEKTDSTTMQEMSKIISKTKRFYIKPRIDDSRGVRVNTKIDPKRFVDSPLQFNEADNDYVMTKFLYFLWLILRSKTTGETIFPNFAAWRLLSRKFTKKPAKKTVVIYLPPINPLVTSFSTIYQFLTYMQKLCREANMLFVNITLL